MLLLTRRPGDRMHIGDSIVVRVLSIYNDDQGPVVELGTVAPPALKILRGELFDRIRRGLAIFKPTRHAA